MERDFLRLQNQCHNVGIAISAIVSTYEEQVIACPTILSLLKKMANRASEHEHGSFIVLVVGPVKSGKSTLVNLIANAYVSPTHFLECTVRPSIISKQKDNADSLIVSYSSAEHTGKVELIDSILDCVRGLDVVENIADVKVHKALLTLDNVEKIVALDLSESLTSKSLITSITTPGGILMQDKIYVLDMPGFDGKYANIDDPIYDTIAQRADLIIFVQSSNSAISKVSKEFLDILRRNNQDVPVCLIHNVFDAAYWRDVDTRTQTIDTQKEFAYDEIRKLQFQIKEEYCFCINLGKVEDSRKPQYADNTELQEEAKAYDKIEHQLYERVINHRDTLRLENCLNRAEQQRVKLVNAIMDELENRKSKLDKYKSVKTSFSDLEILAFSSIECRIPMDYAIEIKNIITGIYVSKVGELGRGIRKSNSSTKAFLKDFISDCEHALNQWIKTNLVFSNIEDMLYSEFLSKLNEIQNLILEFGGTTNIIDNAKLSLPSLPEISLKQSINVEMIVPYRFPPILNLRGGHTFSDIVEYLKIIADKLGGREAPNVMRGYVESTLLPPILDFVKVESQEIVSQYRVNLETYMNRSEKELLNAIIPDKNDFEQMTIVLTGLLAQTKQLKILQ